METKNQMLKILPFNSLNFSDSSVSFSSKSESYKFFPSRQIFGIWAWAVGTGGLLMGLIMWSNVPPIIPKYYTKELFDFQKIHFYILPVSYFRLMLRMSLSTRLCFHLFQYETYKKSIKIKYIHVLHSECEKRTNSCNKNFQWIDDLVMEIPKNNPTYPPISAIKDSALYV